jgi:hypothetical protein
MAKNKNPTWVNVTDIFSEWLKMYGETKNRMFPNHNKGLTKQQHRAVQAEVKRLYPHLARCT